MGYEIQQNICRLCFRRLGECAICGSDLSQELEFWCNAKNHLCDGCKEGK